MPSRTDKTEKQKKRLKTSPPNKSLELSHPKRQNLEKEMAPTKALQASKDAISLTTKNAETAATQRWTQMTQAFATENIFLLLPLLMQAKLSSCVSNDPGNDPGAQEYVVGAIHSIGARDGLEALLASQMVATHSLAMHCMAVAGIDDQTEMGKDVNINRAIRLMRTFTAQVEALKKYRSNGEQHCRVEHVHVHGGGQAVVGTIDQNGAPEDRDVRATRIGGEYVEK